MPEYIHENVKALVFAFLFNKWWFIVSYDQIPWDKSMCLFIDMFFIETKWFA